MHDVNALHQRVLCNYGDEKKKELMWLETPSYCDALLFEIKNKIIYFMIVFFLKIVTCTLQHSEMC